MPAFDPQRRKHPARVTPLAFAPDFPGLRGVTFTARDSAIEPFLVVTEFHMDRPVFGPHPHAGISVMTYILPDSPGTFLNRDSAGDMSRIEPGALHITQAGSGIHHDEFPIEPGVDAHGFQIWINHRATERFVPPRAMHVEAKDVPIAATDAATVRVLHGAFDGRAAPVQMVTDVTLLHVMLRPEAELSLPASAMAFAYGLAGRATSETAAIAPQTLVVYDDAGDHVVLRADHAGAELLFATGTPIREPITYGGPFVTTTREQMAEAQARHARGEMGRLAPYRERG